MRSPLKINEGLESTTFSVLAEDHSDITSAPELVFKVYRQKDKEILAVLSPTQTTSGVSCKENLVTMKSAPLTRITPK